MSGRFVRASSFRHVFGETAKKENQYANLKPAFNGDGNYIAANEHYFAVALQSGGGGPLYVHDFKKVGRVGNDAPKILVHKAAVTDFTFSPFISSLIATASEDCTVKLTNIPSGGLTENITTAAASLDGHLKKVTLLAFHPTANNILASASADNTIKIWDVASQSEALNIEEHSQAIHAADWNDDGSLMATTSQDKILRVFDPRDAKKSCAQAPGCEGNKASKVVFANNLSKMIVVGFNRQSMRQIVIYDPKKLSQPLSVTDFDQGAGQMIPFYDNDNSILYIAGKGDASIKYYEIVDSEPYCHYLTEYRDNESQKGICFLPKRALDTGKCEIARALRLMRDTVIPISFQVPRKSEMFQQDLYPDTYAGLPSLEAKEWLSGENKAPAKMSMKPGTKREEAKVEFKARPSPAELEADLAKAHARIAELEKELAALKAK